MGSNHAYTIEGIGMVKIESLRTPESHAGRFRPKRMEPREQDCVVDYVYSHVKSRALHL